MALTAFVAVKYRFPLERMNQTVDRHRAYLRELHAKGKLVASGPFEPRVGGGFLMKVEDRAELDAILKADPYHQEELVDTTIYQWNINIGGV